MAHKKSGGAKARQGSKSAGKRLGIKVYAGQYVSPGQIIIKQRGSTFHSGEGVKKGRDFTLFATKRGKVLMKTKKGKKVVDVKELR